MVADLPFKGDLAVPIHSVSKPIKNIGDLEILVLSVYELKYYVAKGIGDERFVEDKALFEMLKAVAKKHAKDVDLGGNASTMAWRAYMEGCRIKVGFPLNEEYFLKYFGGNSERVEIIGGLQDITDYHLSLNYFINDDLWNIDIPRSNRIFMNHDIDNNMMKSVDSALKNLKDVDLIAIGGTQLPSNFTNYVEKLELIKSVLSLPENLEKQIHLESSAFSNYSFYEKQLDILLPRVIIIYKINSFGMNEREFIEFYRYLASRVHS